MEPYIGYTFHENKDSSINHISKSSNSIDSNISNYYDSDEEIIKALEQNTESPMSLSSLENDEENKMFKAIQFSSNISLDNIEIPLSPLSPLLPPSPPINKIVKKTFKKRKKVNSRTPTPNMYHDLQQYFDK